MNAESLNRRLRVVVALGAAGVLCTACDTTPQKPAPAPAPLPAAPAPPPPPPPPPAAPTRADKERAQRMAIDALELLQRGEEPNASGLLDQALRLDPSNDTAKKLAEQIRADAQKELGPVSWKYTISPGDSMATIAQRFLGDKLLFYILAKYNNIAVPNRVAVGLVIRIPGKEPPKRSAPSSAPMPAKPMGDEPAAMPAPAPPPVGAAPKPTAPAVDGATTDAASPAQRKALIVQYTHAADRCQSQEQLDCAIRNWDNVLALDPTNEPARLKREKAINLQKKLKGL